MHIRDSLKLVTAVTALLLPLSASASAEAVALPDDPAAKGLAIAEETDRRNQGFGDTKATMKMILENAYGETSERALRSMTLENPNPEEGDWTLNVFDKPRDVDGTALLTYAKILDPDDQWMYLPAVKRVKRISSVNKSGPFMGSEFAFEDFSSTEVGKYSYKWLRDELCPEPVAERTCHVTERYPLYEHSGYTRQVVWTDTTDYQGRKVEYYDRKGELLKTLTLTDYKLYESKFWRAHDLFMANVVTGKSTRLTWEEYSFGNGLTQNDFSTNALQRAR
ncbi:MAG: outer membrane lipoprotein-sorting protein [Parvibaculum sp.]|uniref:outer membrane lipoprotein-sorting protein n=1 Tax=Parvibaculum sp. TaxID=2024848 RepID=UPI00271C01AE|nr:outer membrane lipoprotein-sorting protein [Parvibaculum sp.]MDO8839021.1 outer membrane lipoprotein-sorting protein [Parvibaculum sp.]